MYQNILPKRTSDKELQKKAPGVRVIEEEIKTRFHSCVGHVLRRDEEAVELLKREGKDKEKDLRKSGK